jgi:ATP-dependent Clp protease ATP-binding subunit ClpA
MAFFSRFTERAQRALMTAQKEAAGLGRSYVGTEHLLLGCCQIPAPRDAVLGGVLSGTRCARKSEPAGPR